MGAANFCMMEKFPLYVRDFYVTFKYCPECGTYMDDGDDAVNCPNCGTELLEKPVYDDIEAVDVTAKIENRLEELNGKLLFHTVHLMPGYYRGVQLYVEEKHDPNEYDNEDCRYYFDMNRSTSIRKYNSEINKINRALAILGKEFGFQEMVCVDVFSNGEVWFSPV